MDKNIKDINMEAKKTEKLVSAIYLLTSFFNDLEPMKWSLRKLGGELISQKENYSTIREIIGLLNVAKNAGLVSEMNHAIMSREFSNLLPEGQTLGEIFKQIEAKEPLTVVEEPKQNPVAKSPIYLSSSIGVPQLIKDKTTRDSREGDGVVALKKNSRQSTILNLLKKKKEIMIKDVSPLIPGVSEKTIQRELLTMVHSGILRKMGEKRWSRYTLAE